MDDNFMTNNLVKTIANLSLFVFVRSTSEAYALANIDDVKERESTRIDLQNLYEGHGY